MTRSLLARLVGLLLLVSPLVILEAQAQERPAAPTDTTQSEVRVVLTSGTILVGVIGEETADTITIRTADGVVSTVERSRIEGIYPAGTRQGMRPDPNRSRLLFAPTGRALPKGQGYFADYYIFLPFVGYGTGGGVTLSAGLSLIPAISLRDQLLYIAPKLTVYSAGTVDVALGVLAAGIAGEGSAGLAFGVATFGPTTSAGTVGLGFGRADGTWASRPVVLLGYEHQVSNSVKLITENYVLPFEETEVILSGGVRFFGDALSADIGLATVASLLGEGGFPFIPTVSFAYVFGQ